MTNYLVFYGQQIYGEFDTFPGDLPEGAYVKTPKHWYIVLSGAMTPINLSDIPKEVRLNCLLMGIQL